MKQNIKFDFTATVEQIEVAVMPAHLAVKLLKMYASELVRVPVQEIVGMFIDDMREAAKDSMAVSIDVARQWVEERSLIHNISTNNWDVYAVQPTVEMVKAPADEDTSIIGDVPQGVKIIGKINLDDDTFGGPNTASSAGI